MNLKLIGLLLVLSIVYGCGTQQNEINEPASLVELSLIDSVEIRERQGFLLRPNESHLINDTLLGVASIHSPGIWIFDQRSGKEHFSITNGSFQDISFYPSKVFFGKYPILFILDGLSQSILQLEIGSGENKEPVQIQKIKLDLPKGTWVTPQVKTFWVDDSNFYLELSAEKIKKSSQQYYKEAGEFIGVFGKDGSFENRIISYPKSLTELTGFLEPSQVYSAGLIDQSTPIFAFPSEKDLMVVTGLPNTPKTAFIPLPSSTYFDYTLPLLEKEASGGLEAKNPQLHFLGEVKTDGGNYYFQSFMKDNQNLDTWSLKSHIIKYNSKDKTWTESLDPKEFIQFGELAGVKNDTLYILDAGMFNKDQKILKRAILKSKSN